MNKKLHIIPSQPGPKVFGFGNDSSVFDSRTGEHWQREVPFVEIKAKQVIRPQIFILCYSYY